MLYILSVQNVNKETMYVDYIKPTKLNGKSRGDWGYVTRADQALPVSEYHKRRFLSDHLYCGRTANATPVKEDK